MSESEQDVIIEAEIKELEGLIATAEGSSDPETRWAVYLLKEVVKRRKTSLGGAADRRPQASH